MNRLKNSLPILAALMALYTALVNMVPKMTPEVVALVILGAAVGGLLWPIRAPHK